MLHYYLYASLFFAALGALRAATLVSPEFLWDRTVEAATCAAYVFVMWPVILWFESLTLAQALIFRGKQ